MATFELEGIDDLIADMRRRGELTGEVATAVLQAGAEGVKRGWREAIEAKGLVKSGDMLNSVGYKPTPKKTGNGWAIDISLQGTDHRGVRNGEKGAWLHYGTSKIKGTRWVDMAEELAEGYATPAMREAWESYLETGQVPTVTISQK